MTFLLDVTLRMSAPVIVALLACALMRRHSAALRHRVLAAALFAAMAVAPLSVVLPAWSVALPAAVSPIEPAARGLAAATSAAPASGAQAEAPTLVAGQVSTAAPPPARRASSIDALAILFALWLVGAATGGAMLLLGIVRLVRMTRRAEPVGGGVWRRLAADVAARYGIRRPVAIFTTSTSDVLATWGLFRPRVLLPAQAHSWTEERAHVALCHELAHVQRADWAVQMAADVLRAVFWFNPFVWMLCASLRRESERACDDAVLGAGVPASAYASQLLDIARACRRPASSWVPAMPVARPSTLEGRITAMLDSRLNRQAPTWGAAAFIMVALAAIVLPIASYEVSAQDVGPGGLTGYVYDSSGGALPGVEVTLTGGPAAARSAVSDATGRFAFSSVAAGKYVLEVTLPGFRTLRNEFVLATPRDWARNITMQVGELEETIYVKAKRPARAVTPAPARSSAPIRVGGNIKQPTKLKNANPLYPAAMQAAGLEGMVPMDAVIGVDGRVVSVRVLSAEVHPAFAQAAEEAVRQWIFSPTLLNGKPVEVEMTVSIEFSLED